MRQITLAVAAAVLFPAPCLAAGPPPEGPLPASLLPAGGEGWDYLGTFRLRGEGRVVTVTLYARDTDSLLAKLGARMNPNGFSLHARYRVGRGRWAHQELYGAAAVSFSKVQSVRPEAVVLELHPKVWIDWSNREMDETDEERFERAASVNRPFTKVLVIAGGVPTLRSSPEGGGEARPQPAPDGPPDDVPEDQPDVEAGGPTGWRRALSDLAAVAVALWGLALVGWRYLLLLRKRRSDPATPPRPGTIP